MFKLRAAWRYTPLRPGPQGRKERLPAGEDEHRYRKYRPKTATRRPCLPKEDPHSGKIIATVKQPFYTIIVHLLSFAIPQIDKFRTYEYERNHFNSCYGKSNGVAHVK